jgi:YD repeat-containing protein
MKAVLLTLILFLVFSESPGQTNKKKIDGSPLLNASTTKIRLDSTITYWESSGEKDKIHFIYNSIDLNTEAIVYDFDNIKKDWKYSAIEKCTYDSVGHLTSVISDWGYQHKKVFKYDKNGYLSSKILYQKYNESSDDWYAIFNEEYRFDTLRNEIYAIIYIGEHCIFYCDENWNPLNVKWAEADSLEFKYNSQGDIISKDHYDKESRPIVKSEREEYAYETNQNSITHSYYISSIFPLGGDLVFSRKIEYFYDNKYRREDLVLPYVFDDYSADRYMGEDRYFNALLNYKIDERINYASQINSQTRVKYYYSDQTVTGAKELPVKEIRIYPNPATSDITIYFDGIQGPAIFELFNDQGQSVMKKSVSRGNSVSVNHLPRGLYLYKLHLPDKMKTGKILLN